MANGPRQMARSIKIVVMLCSGLLGCTQLFPERVSLDDPRLKPMFKAMERVDRASMGFTPIGPDAKIRLEFARNRLYDAMLHVSGKTSRTVAFKRTHDGYEWIFEQETFEGPHKFKSVDGTFSEAITITYNRVAGVAGLGSPVDTLDVIYFGEDPELAWPKPLSLNVVRPWLTKWGYY